MRQQDYRPYLGYSAYQKDVSGGGRMDIVEGKSPSRVVVIEFKDYETALACAR
jgi:uncharacterized protein (DUF1330 family)